MNEADKLFLIVLPFALPIVFVMALAILWKAEAAINRALRKRRRP